MSGSKVLLCGYQRAGCGVLEHLLSRDDVDDLAVFTHVAGPGSPDLDSLARRHGVWTSTEDVSRSDLPFEPDVVASVYYRKIISEGVIRRCGGKIFNAHPSLLPRHRGCSSIPWAIIEGDTVTGVTFHYIDPGVDTGRIILQTTVQIAPTETQATLYARCMEQVVRFWPAAFELVAAGFPGVEQEGESCYHRRGAPYDGAIGEDWTIDVVERFIRAMIFPPLPPATFRGVPVTSLDEYLRLRRAMPELTA